MIKRRRKYAPVTPKKFPRDVTFISWIVEPGTLSAIHLANTAVPRHIEGVRIEIVDKKHPCYSPWQINRKLVATRDFAWGEELGPGIGFCGELVHDGLRSVTKYMAECDETVSIDAQRFGNELRFINSYKGIRATPNTQFHWRLKPDGLPYLAVVCVVSVEKGEEFLLDYGKPYDNEHLPSYIPHQPKSPDFHSQDDVMRSSKEHSESRSSKVGSIKNNSIKRKNKCNKQVKTSAKKNENRRKKVRRARKVV
mmetsp:Transcript_9350/g.15197  ORF Transcript_9350/g.15197 Transcript_9350/m.15197 type:complete len:252 (+) Transcript_9350:1211-1966(+)